MKTIQTKQKKAKNDKHTQTKTLTRIKVKTQHIQIKNNST